MFAEMTRRRFQGLLGTGLFAGAIAKGDSGPIRFKRVGQRENKLELLSKRFVELDNNFGSAGERVNGELVLSQAFLVDTVDNGVANQNPEIHSRLAWPSVRRPLGEKRADEIKRHLEGIIRNTSPTSYRIYWNALKDALTPGLVDLFIAAFRFVVTRSRKEYLAFVGFGITFVADVHESLDQYSLAKPIYDSINKDSFLFHVLELDKDALDKEIKRIDAKKGGRPFVLLQEALVYQSHPTSDRPEFSILWSARYEALEGNV